MPVSLIVGPQALLRPPCDKARRDGGSHELALTQSHVKRGIRGDH